LVIHFTHPFWPTPIFNPGYAYAYAPNQDHLNCCRNLAEKYTAYNELIPKSKSCRHLTIPRDPITLLLSSLL